MTRYKSAVQKRNAAVLLRKPGRLASQYAVKEIKNLGNNIYEVKTGPYDDEYWYGNRHFKTIRLRRIEAGDYQFISVQ